MIAIHKTDKKGLFDLRVEIDILCSKQIMHFQGGQVQYDIKAKTIFLRGQKEINQDYKKFSNDHLVKLLVS